MPFQPLRWKQINTKHLHYKLQHCILKMEKYIFRVVWKDKAAVLPLLFLFFWLSRPIISNGGVYPKLHLTRKWVLLLIFYTAQIHLGRMFIHHEWISGNRPRLIFAPLRSKFIVPSWLFWFPSQHRNEACNHLMFEVDVIT